MSSLRRTSLFLVLVAVTLHGLVVIAQSPQATYTQAQAGRGKTTYEQRCAECHHEALKGNEHAPELAGSNFLNVWGDRTAAQMFDVVKRSMPPSRAGSLSDEAYVDVIAYILQANRHADGSQPLRADSALRFGAVGAGASVGIQAASATSQPAPGAARPPFVSRFTNKAVSDFRPVTDEMLAQPSPGDWLSWRRTLNGQGYSPLTDIDRNNVADLRMAWAWSMNDGSNETTPLVHDGIMYLINPRNIVQALEARTGELIWEYVHTFPPEALLIQGGPSRNIAIYKDKIFFSTVDAFLIALDARTGNEVWKTQKADYRKGYSQSSGPIVANGVVISGISGCEKFKKEGCFITGHDPDTGKELWRTSTIAMPGDPNDATWAKVAPEFRAGGDTWIPGSYDPQLGLFYIGTAQAKPWMAASRGMTTFDAALYTNSTLALDPKTGKMVWYFQHVPGETFDHDSVFERVLVDIGSQKLLFTIGKDGILWKLDRQTGKFIDFVETVYQNIFDSLDRRTGRVKYRNDIVEQEIGKMISVCPGVFGGHDWPATAYSPEATAIIIPLQQACNEMTPQKVEMVDGGGGFGARSRSFVMPNVDGKLGKLAAVDVTSMKEMWSHQQRATFTTGILTTASGLAFVGDLERYFRAFDVRTGRILWQARLAAPPSGFPVTFTAGGKQFVAVPTGLGVWRSALTGQLSPEIYQAANGSALYVFELPDRK